MRKIATFDTTTGALQFEKKLKFWGMPCTLKPIPRSIHASCGLCVEFDEALPKGSEFEALSKIYIKTESGFEVSDFDF